MLGDVLVRQPTVILRVSSSRERRMLGYVHNRQPNRDRESFYVNARMCAQSTTDRDLERVFNVVMFGYVHHGALDKNLDHL